MPARTAGLKARRRNPLGVAPAPTATPFFADSFVGGVTNPYGGFVYNVPVEAGDTGGISGCTVVASGDSGAQVEAGFTHSLRMRHEARAIGLQDGHPQLNFTFGRSTNELWFEWRLHVPSNYTHRNNYNPGVTALSDNNKFWVFWSTAYSSGYHQVACETETNGSGELPSNGISRTRPMMRYSNSGSNTDVTSGVDFIGSGLAIVPGTWNTIRCYTKKETTQGAANGVYKMWVNGTLIHNHTGLLMGATDPAKFSQGLTHGYLLGPANAGYTAQTDFHTQWIKFYDTNPGWT